MPLENNANGFIFLHDFDGPSKEKRYYVCVFILMVILNFYYKKCAFIGLSPLTRSL